MATPFSTTRFSSLHQFCPQLHTYLYLSPPLSYGSHLHTKIISMSVLPQHKFISPLENPKRHQQCSHRVSLIGQVNCLAATTTTKSKPNHGSLTIEPQQPLPLPSLPLSPSRAVVDDLSLNSTLAHRAWVACGSTTVLISLAKSVLLATESQIWVEPILAGLVGYVMADLGSGVYHWGIDNYGGASTPVFGSQIEGFQGHHKWPWTITRREFANNLHDLPRAVTFFVLPIDLLCNDPTTLGFVAICSGGIMFSQQFHAWAHGTKSKLPPLVVALQDGGILVSRTQHGAHHRPPYNNNYCIVSGVWNNFLDKQNVFGALEMVMFLKFGVRPRSWSDPSSDWTEDYDAPTTQLEQ